MDQIEDYGHGLFKEKWLVANARRLALERARWQEDHN